jgi:hypothetical protein
MHDEIHASVEETHRFIRNYRAVGDVLDAVMAEHVAAQRAFIVGDFAAARARLDAAMLVLGLDDTVKNS